MAAIFQPNILLFTAGGTIVLGHAVKFSTTAKTVVECTASTDESIGIAAGSAASGEPVEVYIAGGGGKAVAHTTITRGQLLVPYTDGTLQKISGASDRVIALAMDSAAAGDIIPVHVIHAQATATEA